MMHPLRILEAWKGDNRGNLIFRGTARNFNPPVATAGKVTIAEATHVPYSVPSLQCTLPSQCTLPTVPLYRISPHMSVPPPEA